LSQSSTRTLAYFVLVSIILGIILMAVAEHVDSVFLAGLGMFSIGLVISIVWGMWNVAGFVDSKIR